MTYFENSTDIFLDNLTDASPSASALPESEFNINERYVAATIMLIAGVSGFIANIWALKIIWKSEALHNCFGYLLFLHACSEALVLCTFIFWSVPVTLSDGSLSKSTLGFKIGHVVMIIYYATLYVQLFKAINRFFAIFSPVNYRVWFSKKNSKYIITAVITFSLLHGILYFFPGCNFYYNGYTFVWSYDETSCYEVMAFYVDFIIGCSIMGISMFVDACTLCLILKAKLCNSKTNRDIRFFTQAFTTSILYTVMLIIVQLLSRLDTDKWYVFGTVTCTWELCHTIDGFIIVSFNFRRQRKVATSSVVPSKDFLRKSSVRVTSFLNDNGKGM